MIELTERLRSVDLPYTIHIPGVTEAQFDELVDEDTKAELLDRVMIVHSPATTQEEAAGFLRELISAYAEERRLGEVPGPRSLVRLGPAGCCAQTPTGFRRAANGLVTGCIMTVFPISSSTSSPSVVGN
jgi:hypothetical protein